jgi:DNA-binding NarL/FixJ family response regulator
MTTVLVCDDAPQARQAIVRAVSAIPGVERVTAAGSGEEVLARFPIERPDLVFGGIVRMPGIGGVECRGASSAHPEATVVMLTMGETSTVSPARSAGRPRLRRQRRSREEVAATVAMALATSDTQAVPCRLRVRSSRFAVCVDRAREQQQVLDGMSRGKSNADRPRALPVRGHRRPTRAGLFRQAGRGRPCPGRRARVR